MLSVTLLFVVSVFIFASVVYMCYCLQLLMISLLQSEMMTAVEMKLTNAEHHSEQFCTFSNLNKGNLKHLCLSIKNLDTKNSI